MEITKTITKETFLSLLDSGRFEFPLTEIASTRSEPYPLEDAVEDFPILDRPPALFDIVWKFQFKGSAAVNDALRQHAADTIRLDIQAWHALAARLTDEEWEAMWSANSHRLGVAAACASWAARLSKPV